MTYPISRDHWPASEPDWTTLEGLGRIREKIAATIPGWVAPTVWAVAAGDQLPVLNRPGGRHGLASVVLAWVIVHDGSTATLPLSADELGDAVTLLSRAEQCPGIEHPNLVAWRSLLASSRTDFTAIFVRDLGDPISSAIDQRLRVLVGP